MHNRAAVSWQSTRQQVTALSTAEAEYYAASVAGTDVTLATSTLTFITYVSCARTESWRWRTQKVASADQVADSLTKSMPKPGFNKHQASMLGLPPVPGNPAPSLAPAKSSIIATGANAEDIILLPESMSHPDLIILIPFQLRVCSRKLILLAFHIVSEVELSIVEKSPVTSGNYNSDPEATGSLELLRDKDSYSNPLPLYGGLSSRPFI
eukprot:3635815-Rhodomonas_salina.1